jgi:hypothetical protein
MTKSLLIILTVILFVPNLIKKNIFKEKPYDNREEYEPGYAYLNTVEKLISYMDSFSAEHQVKDTSYEYVFEVSKLVRRRFYHGYSHFSLNENWIAALSGKFIENGLGCKVHPEKILQNQNAACSQQAIVMMAVLRKKGITYRHLGFPHHYTVDVLINGKWYFFDPNMEPTMSRAQRSEDAWHYHSDSLKKYYAPHQQADIQFAFGNGLSAVKGEINDKPGPNARFFHATTEILSKTLWCIPLLLLILQSRNLFPFKQKSRKALASV